MIVPNNEGKACDAVIIALEKRTKQAHGHVRDPEKEKEGAPVDLRLKLGDREYAPEHTRIEPYPEVIYKFAKFAKPIMKYVKKHIPVPLPSIAYYELQFPMNAGPFKESALKALVEWVRESEETLRNRNPVDWSIGEESISNDRITGAPPGFELLQWRQAQRIGRKSGDLGFRIIPPDNRDLLLKQSLCEAFSKKCPKLYKCKWKGREPF